MTIEQKRIDTINTNNLFISNMKSSTVKEPILEHRGVNKQILFSIDNSAYHMYKKDSYEFKGVLNLTHVVNNCIDTGQSAFVIFNQGSLVFGVTKQLDINSSPEYIENSRKIVQFNQTVNSDPFHIYVNIPLQYTKGILSLAKKIPEILKKQIKKEKYKVQNARRKQRQTNIKNKKKDKKAKWVKADRVKVLVY